MLGVYALKAVFFEEHGDLDVLRYGSLPTPEPGPGDVLIELKAAALNRVDLFVREGWPGLDLEMPHIPGADGAGIVAEVGPQVTTLQPGDRVVINANLSCGRCEFCRAGRDNMCREWELLGETVRGTYAQYVAVPELNALRLPDHFGFAEAAAASLVYLTAWHSLITRGGLKAGETVLIIGASGGVNTAAIQIAALAGATLYVVGSTAEKLAQAGSLGADHLIDRSEDADWSRSVYMMTGKRGVDVVVDNVGKATMAASLRAARTGGRILTVGNTSGPVYELDNRYLFAKHLSLLGSTMGTRPDFDKVMGLLFRGRLKPVIGANFPLAEARQAQQVMAEGEQFGKIVLDI